MQVLWSWIVKVRIYIQCIKVFDYLLSFELYYGIIVSLKL
jgi:hypothetical protein